MILVAPEIRAALRENYRARHPALANGEREPDPANRQLLQCRRSYHLARHRDR